MLTKISRLMIGLTIMISFSPGQAVEPNDSSRRTYIPFKFFGERMEQGAVEADSLLQNNGMIYADMLKKKILMTVGLKVDERSSDQYFMALRNIVLTRIPQNSLTGVLFCYRLSSTNLPQIINNFTLADSRAALALSKAIKDLAKPEEQNMAADWIVAKMEKVYNSHVAPRPEQANDDQLIFDIQNSFTEKEKLDDARDFIRFVFGPASIFNEAQQERLEAAFNKAFSR